MIRGRDAGPYGSRLLGPAHQSVRALRLRVQVLLTVLLVVTNVIGAGTVASILLLVRPTGGTDPDFVLASFIAVPVYVAVAVVVGATVGTRGAFAALRWAYEGREPTETDRVRTLRVPRTLTFVQAGLWAFATALFSGLALLLDPSLFTTELLAIGITGALISAIAYLVTEFVLRPVAARALADVQPTQTRGSGVRRRMIGFWAIGSGVPAAGTVVVGILALTDDEITRTRLAVVAIVLGVVVLLVRAAHHRAQRARRRQPARRPCAGASSAWRTASTASPSRSYDGTELGLLQSGFNRMSAGLAERERMRDLFGRHVGQDVAAAALEADVELGGEVRVVSVLFVDVKGSTTLATQRPPSEVVDVLNRFCSVVVAEVDRHHGLVNKFMGDAVLAVFGAPVPRDGPRHRRRCAPPASMADPAARGAARGRLRRRRRHRRGRGRQRRRPAALRVHRHRRRREHRRPPDRAGQGPRRPGPGGDRLARGRRRRRGRAVARRRVGGPARALGADRARRTGPVRLRRPSPGCRRGARRDDAR